MDNYLDHIERYEPSITTGLLQNQVNQRIEQNLVNHDTKIKTKTIPQIVLGNTVTLFNIINIIFAAAILYVGSYKNLLFMGVIICNIIIGTYQEIMAKKTVDKLSIISSTKVNVIRDSSVTEIGINDVVLDDIIILQNGNQIVADCIIVEGQCEVNESLISGESDPLSKKVGDTLLSGSFIVSGKCKAKVEHIGKQNYAATISNIAKHLKKPNSEIMATLNKIIKFISIMIIPVGTILFINQLNISGNSYQDAIVNTVAALIGMIPEGLILLTSTVLAVGVVRLSKYKVLVQELYCIETLARVDVLCLDKTGTITEGRMKISQVISYNDYTEEDISQALCSLTSVLEDNNPTFNAVKEMYSNNCSCDVKSIVPFSSARKWSGIALSDGNTYIMGAAEFIMKGRIGEIKGILDKYIGGNRVIVLAHSNGDIQNEILPDDIEIMAFILIADTIRPEAKDTLKYFEDEGVSVKIISGDNVSTVSNIAKCAGLKDADKCIDASTLSSDEDVINAANQYTVFGRVSPQQKKLIISALKQQGHTVAMTGDGVNDVLALKESDCSIAMAGGSDAARSVSQLVLLDSNFSSMPKVVAEGRRCINNIQRSASLFLVKTIYSTLLALIFLFISAPYPFMPIQMTLISSLTIGIPSFILALEPNTERLKGHFASNVVRKAFPGALSIVSAIMLVVASTRIFNISQEKVSTLCVLLAGFVGLLIVYKVCLPFNLIRKVLFISITSIFVVSVVCFKTIFSISQISFFEFGILIGFSIISFLIFRFITNLLAKYAIQKIKARLIKDNTR